MNPYLRIWPSAWPALPISLPALWPSMLAASAWRTPHWPHGWVAPWRPSPTCAFAGCRETKPPCSGRMSSRSQHGSRWTPRCWPRSSDEAEALLAFARPKAAGRRSQVSYWLHGTIHGNVSRRKEWGHERPAVGVGVGARILGRGGSGGVFSPCITPGRRACSAGVHYPAASLAAGRRARMAARERRRLPVRRKRSPIAGLLGGLPRPRTDLPGRDRWRRRAAILVGSRTGPFPSALLASPPAGVTVPGEQDCGGPRRGTAADSNRAATRPAEKLSRSAFICI